MSFNHIWNKIKTRSEKLMIAGPCSAESAEQLLVSAKALIGSVHLMRAGVWKPRTRPGSFEGHGEVALGWLADLKKSMGLRFCVEVANRAQVKLALDAEADAIWIGARTTAGPFIVQEIAEAILEFNRTDILVMVKNPQAPDLSLWLGAIERLETVGCKNIVAIHRGFTSYHSKSYRNSPYWKIVFELRAKRPDLIVISDPSHVAGLAELVPEIVYKAVEMDLDGLMIEVHPDPENALSDKAQQLTPEEFHFLKNDLKWKEQEFQIDEIKQLRLSIDELDRSMLEILAEREKLVKKIGEYKKKFMLPSYQKDRHLEMMRERREIALELGLNVDFAEKVFQDIHAHSVDLQDSELSSDF